MSVLFFCGFEYGDGQSEANQTSGTQSVQGTVKHTGDLALRCYPTTTGTGFVYVRMFSGTTPSWANYNKATLYVTFDFRYATKPSSNDECIAQTHNALAYKAELRLNSAGNLVLYDSTGSALGTGSATLAADTWYRLGLKIGTGTSSGTYEVTVNGTADISPGSNGNFTSTNNNRVYLGKVADRNNNTVDFFYDNLIVDDSAYANASAVVKRLSPDGDGTYTAFTIGSGTGSDWQQVDETGSVASDSTYLISTGSAGDASTVTLASCASASISGTILGALIRTAIHRNAEADGSVKIRARSGGTDYDSDAVASIANNGYHGTLYLTDPATSSAWTTSGLDGLEVGLVENDTDITQWFSLHVMVAYVPSGTTYATRLFRTQQIGLSPF